MDLVSGEDFEMSSATVKETKFTEEFREFIASESDTTLRELREKAFAYFAANGFPSRDTKTGNTLTLPQWSVKGGRCQWSVVNITR